MRMLQIPLENIKKIVCVTFFPFSKQYRKYTTALLAESDTLLTFGLMGRSFQLSELSMDELSEGITDGDLTYLVMTSITTGIALILIIWRLCRI